MSDIRLILVFDIRLSLVSEFILSLVSDMRPNLVSDIRLTLVFDISRGRLHFVYNGSIIRIMHKGLLSCAPNAIDKFNVKYPSPKIVNNR